MTAATASRPAAKPADNPRATLATCGTAHAIHDGFGDGIYLFLPLWQAELGLSLAQSGMMKAAYSIGLSTLQIPAGLLAERIGERGVLAAGTALLGLGYFAAGWSGGFLALFGAMLLTGIGSAVQHPLSSSLIARAATGARLRVALSTYNFLGDVGKVAVPSAAALLIGLWGWRATVETLGVFGIALGVAIFALLRPAARRAPETKAASAAAAEPDDERATHWPRFGLLAAISMVDGAGRTGALTLLPFLLVAKGADVATVGFALSLVFAGGAAGKFACGLLAIRFGVIGTIVLTELATAAGVLALTVLPITALLFMLPLLGLALNGTSSVLYGSVPETVARKSLARAFALFYTLGIGASAAAPFLYGYLSDWRGLETALAILAAMVLLVLPLTIPLRRFRLA